MISFGPNSTSVTTMAAPTHYTLSGRTKSIVSRSEASTNAVASRMCGNGFHRIPRKSTASPQLRSAASDSSALADPVAEAQPRGSS